MMNRLLLSITLLFLAAAVHSGSSLRTRSRSDWRTFVSKAGAFTVNIPGVPTADSTTMTAEGSSLVMYTYKAQHDSIRYVVTYADYPAEIFRGDTAVEEFLLGAVHGIVSGAKGNLLESRPIAMNGHVGRDVRIEVPVSDIAPEGGSIRLHLYVVGNRMYQLGIFARRNGAFGPKTAQFLESFKLLGR